MDNKRPSLVNLNEDPQLSETLLYILKDGQTKVGQNYEGCSNDVKLCGPLIADNHWWVRPRAKFIFPSLCLLKKIKFFFFGKYIVFSLEFVSICLMLWPGLILNTKMRFRYSACQSNNFLFSILNNVGSIVSVTPMKDALTYVNGNLITEPTRLHHVSRN